MSSHAENNKKIVKNTLALYFRQIITMCVALFTSRIVLQTLGVTDYGINNIVGGVVAMFGFLSGTLMSITQRFITVELGKGGNPVVLQRIFSTSMILHFVAGIVVIILAETIGLWFLNNKLVIPVERMIAANWVYQFAVFGFVLSLLTAPLMALIVSHEDMHIYGYVSIFDVVAKLVTVYLLVIVNADKLIFFALFHFIVVCIVRLFYQIYCRRKYQEAKFTFIYDKSLIKELSGFGGFVLTNSILTIFVTQGTNIFLNIFFGPAVNAAKGLAQVVDNALLSFGNNFKSALVPQMTKSYFAKDPNFKWTIAERGTRISYFLLLIFSIPILLETEFILKLWLGNVPEYTSIFTQLIIIDALITGLIFGLGTVINSSGKYKPWYCIHYILNIIMFVFAYLVCKTESSPWYVLLVFPFFRLLFLPIKLVAIKKLVNLSIKFFVKKALIPIFLVSVISIFPFYFVNNLLSDSFFNSFIIIITSMLWTGLVIMVIGLTKNEQVKIIAFVKRKMVFLR